MDGGRRLITALLLLVIASPAAMGAPRSGSVTDPEDRPPNLFGVKYPDLKGFSVAYEPDSGSLEVGMDLHSPTPAATNGHQDPNIGLSFEVGAPSAGGRECLGPTAPAPRTGDLSVFASHYSGNNDEGTNPYDAWNLHISVAGYSGALASQQGTISADRRRITWSFPGHAALVRRDYTCVTRTQMTSYPDWWIDEVTPFFFSGFAPPPVADTTAPSVRWTSPLDGDVISGVWQEAGGGGRHACRIDARDDVGVVRVDVHLDGRFLNREVYAPWACVLDTTQIANGSHRLTATAYDAAGNSRSSSVTVTVRNTPATPPPDPAPPPVTPPVTPAPLTPVTPAPPAPQVPVTTPAPPATTVAPADVSPPLVRLGFASRSMSGLLRTGLVVPILCDEPCTVRLRLVIDAALARRLRIPRLLRETTVSGGAGARTLALLRPLPEARRALAARKRMDARLLVVASDASGNRRMLERAIRLG